MSERLSDDVRRRALEQADEKELYVALAKLLADKAEFGKRVSFVARQERGNVVVAAITCEERGDAIDLEQTFKGLRRSLHPDPEPK